MEFSVHYVVIIAALYTEVLIDYGYFFSYGSIDSIFLNVAILEKKSHQTGCNLQSIRIYM